MKMIINLFVLLGAMMVSCNNTVNSKSSVKQRNSAKAVVKESLDSNRHILNSSSTFRANKDFMNFVKKFTPINLPFNMEIGSKYWGEDPLGGQKIPRQFAKDYLWNRKDSLFKDIDDDNYYLYYGYSFKMNNTIGLFYFISKYYSKPFYGGYMLSTFDLKGNLKSTIYFTGNQGDNETTVQIESSISATGKIVSNYIDFNFNPKRYYTTNTKKNATLTIKYFQVESDGKLKETKKVIKPNALIMFPDSGLWQKAIILNKN